MDQRTFEQKQFREMVGFNETLFTGQEVKVYWGYGSGFRAQGYGIITKVNRLSVRVRLTADVKSPHNRDEIGWPEGYELKGIPRWHSPQWRRYENCVEPYNG
jgi:hypothetical protein